MSKTNSFYRTDAKQRLAVAQCNLYSTISFRIFHPNGERTSGVLQIHWGMFAQWYMVCFMLRFSRHMFIVYEEIVLIRCGFHRPPDEHLRPLANMFRYYFRPHVDRRRRR